MNVLVIGQGGREHALCWAIHQDPSVEKVFAYPGNPGIFQLPKAHSVNLSAQASFVELAAWAKQHDIKLTVVGPEDPLNQGIVDCFKEHSLTVFGPSKKASQLESSKIFAKNIMAQAGIPTGTFDVVKDFKQAKNTLNENISYPIVLKYDGLAAGKGVVICKTQKEALDFCHRVFTDKVFSDQPKPIVIEEFLAGEELSYFALCHDQKFYFFGDAQDHKRLLDQDLGPNTGGMGAFTPTHLMNAELKKTIEDTMVKPLLQEMSTQGMPYQGFLYLGIILTQNGPKVLEFNVRLGDPEAQCLLYRLKSPLAQTLITLLNDNCPLEIQWKNQKSLVVTLASKNYPYTSSDPQRITIKEPLPENTLLFHCGSKEENNCLYANGGRVLSLVSLGESYVQASTLAYQTIKNHIHFDGIQYRQDIGQRAISHENNAD